MRRPFGGDGRLLLAPVIGHRGAASCAPENTLVGFRKAKALGCRWVEFDVRLTADREPVVIHDDRLTRTTDGRGKVSALALAEIRRYDAGGWFHPSFAGERIPRLEEALALLTELGLGANVELKAARGREALTGTVVAGLLAQTAAGARPDLLLSSFHVGALAAAKARAPQIARGILLQAIPKNWRALCGGLGCATIHADHQRLGASLVSEIRQAGYPLLAYTVNDPIRARILFEWGVTSVFSDDPQRVQEAAAHASPMQRMMIHTVPAGTQRQGQGR